MTLRRTRPTAILGLALLALPIVADAQQGPIIPKVGYLSTWSPSNGLAQVEAFRGGLREHGYIDGTNVLVVSRFAEGRYERLPALAADLVRMKVDVVVAYTTPAALAAQRATATIPIVFTLVSEPVRTGLVASLARPGGNVTGYTDITAELVQKRLALLKELVPRSTRIGVLKNPDNSGAKIASNELELAARQLGLELHGADVRNVADLDSAFAAFTKAQVGSLFVVADSFLVQISAQIARLAMMHRLPLMGWSIAWPRAGALLSYGADATGAHRQLAGYVAKILRGAKPAELPVEQPTRFLLIINVRTASALGLTISQSMLARADQIIE